MSCRQTNRQTIVEVVYLIVCVCQIDSSRLHCCTCPQSYELMVSMKHENSKGQGITEQRQENFRQPKSYLGEILVERY
jgi:hypothetical protein